VDTLAEVLANGNTTGATDIIVTAGQKITTDTIAETTAAAGVTIDSVLLKDDVVNATDIEVDTISANNGTLAVTLGSTGVATIAQQPILSSLTASQAVFTDASKGLVSNAITGTGNVVMSASPTLTGTVTAATINATTLGGTLSTAAQPNVTSLGTLSSLKTSGVIAMNSITPSAWASPLASVIEGGAASTASSSIYFQTNASGIGISTNYYYDGTEKFKLTGDASQFYTNGTNSFMRYATGSENGTITWTNLQTWAATGTTIVGTVKTASTVSVGNATPATSGAGITFPASQSASSDANTLDDYEEGTWTATVTPATSGNITLVTGVNTLAYTKIGRVIQVQGLLEVTSVASPVGGLIQISGLPYTSSNDAYSGVSGGAIYVASLSTGNVVRGLAIPRNNTVVDVIGDAANYQAGSQLYVQFTYRV
jgi:ribosomal protein L12E/L44/L45/RPP1/RPP2